MNIPKIRFKGFEGEWTEMPFTSIAQRISSSGTSGILPGVEFEDIISGEGLLNKNVCDKSCNKIGKLFSCGDVLFGKLRPYLRNILLANFDGVAIGDFWVLHPEGIESKLLYELVNSAAFMHIANISSGSKMPRADWTYVSEASFAIPCATEEQKKISSYFTAIDKQISALTNHIEKLRQMKEASLQAMFPAEGETVPKVRFKGFDGEWKKVKLGEHGKTTSGIGFPEKEQGGISGIPFYKVSDMNREGNERCMNSSANYVSSEQIGRLHWKVCSSIPAIFFAKVGAAVLLDRKRLVVNPCLCDNNTMMYCLDTSFWDANFCLYLFEHLKLSTLVQVGTLPSYNGNAVENMKERVPSLAEQQKIASYFTALDQQISTQTKRLEKLRQIKSACLDAMFV